MPRLVVGSWYLVNSRWYIVVSRWVKYVNNLRIITSINSVNISTKNQLFIHSYITKWVQAQLNKLSKHYFSPIIFTYPSYKINLLNKTFTHNPQGLLLKLIKEY